MDTDTARAALLWGLLILAILSIVVFRVVIDRKVKRAPPKNWENMPRTAAQEQTRIAVQDALRNTQQYPAAAAQPSLTSRLAQLDAALQAGQISQQEYAKARAAILASP